MIDPKRKPFSHASGFGFGKTTVSAPEPCSVVLMLINWGFVCRARSSVPSSGAPPSYIRTNGSRLSWFVGTWDLERQLLQSLPSRSRVDSAKNAHNQNHLPLNVYLGSKGRASS